VEVQELQNRVNSKDRPEYSPNEGIAIIFEILLGLLTTTSQVEVIVGDLEERYRMIAEQSGTRAARRWYWSEISRCLVPLARSALKRVSGWESICRRIGR